MLFPKLSANSSAFVSRLSQNGLSKSLSATLALGRIIGYGVAIPSARVDNINTYFFNMTYAEALALVNEINETVPINTEAVVEAAKKFYSYRYFTAYPDLNVLPVQVNQLASYFKIDRFFSVEEIEAINTNLPLLAELNNGFCKLIEDYNKGSHVA